MTDRTTPPPVYFTEEDRFTITGRGTVSTGKCPEEWDGADPSDIVGNPIKIGDAVYKVLGIEKHATPGPLRAGQPIGVLLGERTP